MVPRLWDNLEDPKISNRFSRCERTLIQLTTYSLVADTSPKMSYAVNVFDEYLKIVFRILVEALMKFFHIMDLLKIFRMQEPVPKDLLPKNSELGKYREVVQEKDVLLRNCKARIRELEQQVADLKATNRALEVRANPRTGANIIKEYETFYLKIMSESQDIVDQKDQMENKLKEMQTFCEDIMEKYEKTKTTINQYEENHDKLKKQILEYEEIIESLTKEYNRLKECMQSSETESKTSIQQLKLRNQLLADHSKSMFEPLKGLDK